MLDCVFEIIFDSFLSFDLKFSPVLPLKFIFLIKEKLRKEKDLVNWLTLI
jgi:hypothetical protein